MSFQSLKNLLKEVVILVALVGFLADDEGHLKSSDGSLVRPAVQVILPHVILLGEKIDTIDVRVITCSGLSPYPEFRFYVTVQQQQTKTECVCVTVEFKVALTTLPLTSKCCTKKNT